MDAKEVAVLLTETIQLVLQKQAEGLSEKVCQLKELLSKERTTWCNSSEDRMYCEDGNWFFRNNSGQPQLAPPPDMVIRMAAELISISKRRSISEQPLKDAKSVMSFLSKLKG